ncbi:phosphoribosylaminoimidazolesuccinocarboxamide synthase [Rubinisphaera brasiliensis]|uniref:Phosphoribosylaminoimidazole-succinocarboxamide synthase n=1 Tax=Rubinisphaera brasiliensis (strain ATCC 49424 / DSM 5305 / JCM 21570 / IAM 15109 / NBRC 103401 / IFAM 1448) TaxID=756272 RepID=F0SMP5_RUBBR|nr:phosphoribosylaminoimidazolesuccinocarboxamide synthase [Rubinisphaera brasiliensis]ADY58864.1 phosphoribosylaminoimidazole-succinocarboxamide synthase [Rubinisphaera brasiliensis DSM 5305]
MSTLLQSEIAGLPKRSGKVRDVYDLGDSLLIVATDRISAFDWILPNGIPEKGRILTQLSLHWFKLLGVENHLISTDPSLLPLPPGTDVDALQGRSMIVRKSEVIPIECVVRGYLAGSGWVDYQKNRTVSGVELPAGLQESEKLPEPIFTPSTKAEEGHDMPISLEAVSEQIGGDVAEDLKQRSIAIYQKAADYAREHGLILADTKFEFGFWKATPEEQPRIILIDEVLTPDSSRYWPADDYEVGRSQNSFDKQYVRDWLLQTDWDRNSPPPQLPDDVVANTAAKYREAYQLLTGREFVSLCE